MARLTLATANDELSYLGYDELGYRFEKYFTGRGYCLVNAQGFVVAHESTLKATFESALSYLSNQELVGQYCELTCELPESTGAVEDEPVDTFVITEPQGTIVVLPETYVVRESVLVSAINHLPTLLSQGYKLYQGGVEFVTPLLFLVALMVKDAQQLVATWFEYYNEPELVLVEPLSRYGVTQRSHLDVYYDTLSDVVTPTVCKLLELRLRLAWWLSR